MRIVLTVHQFLPEFHAGTETLTFLTARELRNRGHSVNVWTGFPAPSMGQERSRFDQYEVEGLPVWRFHHNYEVRPGGGNAAEVEYHDPLIQERFAGYLTDRGVQIVHAFHLARLSASPLEACAELGIPSVFTPTDYWFLCPTSRLRLPDGSICDGPDRHGVNCLRHIAMRTQPRWVGALASRLPRQALRLAISVSRQSWWPERRFAPMVEALHLRPSRLLDILGLVNRILPPTREMHQRLLQFGISPSRLRRIPYGIDLAPYAIARPKTPGSRLRLGFIGTLTWHKGAHILLEAIRSLPQAPVEALLYGDLEGFPGYARHLKDLAGEDARVRFCGIFPREKIAEVLAEIDVLVVPSTWTENTPLVVYSAQAARTPVLASNVPGLTEVIHDGVNGLVFEMGSPASLASAIARLERERALLRQLESGCQDPKSIPEYVDDLEAVYMEILNERRSGP